MSSGVGDLGSP